MNRLGLGNEGAAAIASRIGGMRRPRGFPIGINVVKTHDPAILGDEGLDDFASARACSPTRTSWCSTSPPQQAEEKTFEDPAALAGLLDRVMALRAELGSEVPVLVKLAARPLDATGGFDASAWTSWWTSPSSAASRASSRPTPRGPRGPERMPRLEAIGTEGSAERRSAPAPRHDPPPAWRLEGARRSSASAVSMTRPRTSVCAGAGLLEAHRARLRGSRTRQRSGASDRHGLDRDGHGAWPTRWAPAERAARRRLTRRS